MFQWKGIWLPDGETHLIEWMEQINKIVDGKPSYQYHKYEAAMKFVKKRRVAIDVGSHIGLWATHMARDFDLVHCFEPKLDHRKCWKKNMDGKTNSCLHAVALGEGTKQVTLFTGPSSSGDTRIDPLINGGVIPMTTLDSYKLEEVDFIKIDCEGYEYHVLKGAEETLLREKPVICVEQKPGHGQNFGLTELAGVEYLESLGAVRRGGIQGDFFLSWVD
ncbi:hypothetical protein LCGC14_0232190 [marine sediment metagenome]|uniref:Methyltransferase FkbM domain-containing protein n=1 Tax=marine sediment metagenome TaxID=412755 RepID=A0A0F9WUR9_9ZZZZ